MHQVDFKKRKKLYLRIFSYTLITILTILTTTLLLYAALGYRINKAGEIVRSGLVLINSKPTTAEVFIDGENKNDATDSRFVLPAGKHFFELRQDGYRNWSRNVSLEASGVENIYYPILIPNKLNPSSILTVENPDVVSQSADRKLVFLYTNGSLDPPKVVELDEKAPKTRDLVLPSSFLAKNGSLGSLKVIEWSQDSSHMLIERRQGDATELMSIDLDNPEKTVNITSKLAGISLSDVRYAGSKVDQIYGLSKGKLSVFNIDDGTAKAMMTSVRSYKPFSNTDFSFVRINSTNKRLEAGIFKDGESTVVHSIKSSDPKSSGLAVYSEYDGADYLSLQLDGEKKVTIYRNPLNKPVLKNQLPYASFNLKAKSISSAPSGQYIFAWDGQNVINFDFERPKINRFKAPEKTIALSWLDSNHLFYQTKSNMFLVSEFDGQNSYEILASDYGQLMFSNDLQLSYRIVASGAKAEIQSVNMVVAK